MNGVDEEYFHYLKSRSRMGLRYRRWLLYPRLARQLQGRALDVGCGIGDMLSYRPQTVGADVNPLAVRYCRSLGLDAREMTPDALPFEDASFDSAILDNVLEHIASPGPLLAELHRVLRPGARLLVGVPGRWGWACDADHKVFYDEQALRAAVESADFTCTRMFHTPLFRSSWLDRTFRLYVVWGAFRRDP